MLIQDLNHVEMISEETHLEGGSYSIAQSGAASIGFITANQSGASTSAYRTWYSTGTSGFASASGYAVLGAVQTSAGSMSVA
ncbi:MAG: hypothetical protein ACRCT1_12295 [Microcoleaceae cyanobacterium]